MRNHLVIAQSTVYNILTSSTIEALAKMNISRSALCDYFSLSRWEAKINELLSMDTTTNQRTSAPTEIEPQTEQHPILGQTSGAVVLSAHSLHSNGMGDIQTIPQISQSSDDHGVRSEIARRLAAAQSREHFYDIFTILFSNKKWCIKEQRDVDTAFSEALCDEVRRPALLLALRSIDYDLLLDASGQLRVWSFAHRVFLPGTADSEEAPYRPLQDAMQRLQLK